MTITDQQVKVAAVQAGKSIREFIDTIHEKQKRLLKNILFKRIFSLALHVLKHILCMKLTLRIFASSF